MGAWGHKTFENDHALDWVHDLREKGWPRVDWALDTVVREKELQEAASGEAAVAAVEAVLVALGEDLPGFLEEVPGWDKCPHGKPSPLMIAKAKRAIEYLLTDSDLRERTEDAGAEFFAAWEAEVAQLRERLLKHPSPPLPTRGARPWWKVW